MKKCFLKKSTIVSKSKEIILGSTTNTLEQDPFSYETSIITKGFRFSLSYFRNVMRFKWSSRKKYLSTWNDEILTPLQNLVFGQLNLNNNKIDLLGFTELKVMEELEFADSTGSKTVEHKYRAHPLYHIGPSWHRWENVRWELTDTNIQMFTARMIMFLKTGKDVPTSVRERLPESISNTFVLIQSIDSSVGGNRTR